MNSLSVPQTQGSRRRLLSLALPLIVLVLAFTAVPSALRFPSRYLLSSILHPRFAPFDVASNIVGFLPVGAVLGGLPLRQMLWISSAMSFVAEGAQVFSVGRSPSFVDVATNILGAVIGWALCRRLNWIPRPVAISRRLAGIAAILAVAYVTIGGTMTPDDWEDAAAAFVIAPPWLPVNARGAATPGKLEAHWPLDSISDSTTPDVSDNSLTGTVVNRATLVAGAIDHGIDFNGVNQAIDVGNQRDLRLTGSMTISAWIKPRDYPENNSAIVSNLNAISRGFELDVSTDQGPPVIGFKLTNDAGHRMARYGATRLPRDAWYHVAGVYDAQAQTLNVFLNGLLDNGCLQGAVTSTQRVSGIKTYIGARVRRAPFAGIIDDVRIYSRALTQAELAADGGGIDVSSFTTPANTSGNLPCRTRAAVDGRVAGFAVGLGMLAATAIVGLWPTVKYRGPGLAISLLAGVTLFLTIGAAMPILLRWMLPFLTLAGGLSIILSSSDDSATLKTD